MKNSLLILLSFLAGQALANPIVVDYQSLTRGSHSMSSTQSSTLSTSSSSFGRSGSYSDSISYGSRSGGLVPDGGYRTIGVNVFGGTDSTYGNGNRYLPAPGNHIVGTGNMVSASIVGCPTCGGEGIVRNWWGGRKTCANCKGEGACRICSRCNSTGRVWRWWGWKTGCLPREKVNLLLNE